MNKKIGLLLVLLILSTCVIAKERIIAVEGEGVVTAMPDIIRINYNVFSLHKKNAAKAKAKVDEVSSLSVRALIRLGVSKNDITSSSLKIIEDYDYNDRGSEYFVGHTVRRDIQVVIRDIGLYEDVIQALVNSGISEINKVKADVSNYKMLKRQALASASKSAKDNAEFLALQFGAKLGKVHQIGKHNIHLQRDVEEMVVIGSERKTTKDKIPFNFKPGVITVSSEVFVEFQLN